MVLTVSFVVSLVIGLSCHHRQRIIPPTWYQRRDIRTPRLRRPPVAHSSDARQASTASSVQRL